MGSLKSRQVGSITILQPKGYLTGGEETEELEKAITECPSRGIRRERSWAASASLRNS